MHSQKQINRTPLYKHSKTHTFFYRIVFYNIFNMFVYKSIIFVYLCNVVLPRSRREWAGATHCPAANSANPR